MWLTIINLAFKRFDTDDDGKITAQDLQNYITRKGESWDREKARDLLQSVDSMLKSTRELEQDEVKIEEFDYDEKWR